MAECILFHMALMFFSNLAMFYHRWGGWYTRKVLSQFVCDLALCVAHSRIELLFQE